LGRFSAIRRLPKVIFEAAMHKRLSGLQHECDLLAAEVARYHAGELREYDLGPGGNQIDITDLWIAHLEAVLKVKRSLRRKLCKRYKLDHTFESSSAASPGGDGKR
jgi:hypothetical protein